jgi:predicted SnoaL-like aldol condensation-catalyzing enzyme
MATAAENLATARRWLLEVFNNHNLNAVQEIIADSYWNYGTTALKGIAAGQAVITQADGWAPDRRIDIVEMAAGDNAVFILFTVSGTHTGPFMGVQPSNRPFSVYLCDLFRFDERGMMSEGWVIGKADIKLALEELRAS